MTQPIGSPDWIKPLPGGAKQLINATIDWSTGVYDSGWVDCSAFNGLYLACSALSGNAADFGTINVSFQDQTGAALQLPIYPIVFRGDLRTQLNIPVLGAQFKVHIAGPARATFPTLTMTGHGGGGASGYRSSAGLLASREIFAVGASGTFTDDVSIIQEGPATITADSDANPGFFQIRVYNSAGVFSSLAILRLQAAIAQTVALWLPPRPVQVFFSNNAGVATNIRYGLVAGRP